METTAVILAVDHGSNNAGEVVGFTHGKAQSLCSTRLADGTPMARLASAQEVEASRGKPAVVAKKERIQVRLLRDYANNTTGDDPWYPKQEALALITRGGAIRMPDPEAQAKTDAAAEAQTEAQASKKGAVASRKTAVPKGAVEK